MRRFSSIYLCFLFTGLLLVGCESDDSREPVDGNRQQTTMELLSYSSPFLDVTPWTTTRAGDPDYHFASGYQENHLPNGYKSYEQLHPHASIDDSTIGVFMTPDDTSPSGNFIYRGVSNGVSIWKSNIIVEDGKHYYIYGFMPRSGAENASITPKNDDFANGAVIAINNYDALTTADVAVIVGLRWATAEEKINGIATNGSDVPLGNFSYVGKGDGENRLFVLLKHIYAGLHFATKLDATYANLRSIRITKVELTAVGIKAKINLSIPLTANTTGADPLPLNDIVYEPVSNTTTNETITLYEKTNKANDLGEEVPVDNYKDFLGCMVPGSTENFILKTTYDVYDRNVTRAHPEGNLIRKGCVAENKIDKSTIPTFPELKAGELLTVNLLIKPTFLYMLSEPDLDNPTITITN